MLQLDKKQIVRELASEHGILIDEDDPVLNMVAVNGLVLEKHTDRFVERIDSSLKEFEDSVGKVQRRAGQLVAAEFNDRVVSIRKALQDDIAIAGARANEIIFRIEQANRHPVMLRWAVIGTTVALALFLIGLWIGARYMHV